MTDLKNFKYIELKPNTKEPAHTLDTFIKDISKIDDCAVLVPKNIVVVDFDSNIDIAEKILNLFPTFAVRTERGMHLYYNLPKKHSISNQTNIVTAGAMAVDYKTGDKNKKAMATIKRNGLMREIIKNEISDLPVYLYPVSKTKTPLSSLQEGEGRNSALYKHLLNVFEQVPDIKDEDLQNIANFINNNVFSESLTDNEIVATLQSVIKRITNKTSSLTLSDIFDDKGKVDIFALTEYIIDKLDVKIYNEILYFRKDKDYLRNESNNLMREVAKIISLKQTQHKELKHQLELYADKIQGKYFPIKLKNGFMIHGEDIICKDVVFTPYLLNVNYDPDAYSEDVDNFLNFLTCNREDLRKLIEEMFGHMLMTAGFPQKAFFLVADSGANGKSTFLTMLSNFTQSASSALALEELHKNENLFTLQGKLANLGDDIDPKYLKSSRVFKTLVSGDEIMCRALYEMPIKLRNTATLIFSSNKMPVFEDKSGGIARRLAIIPCDNKVKKADSRINEKLSTDTAKSYILNLAIAGMKRIIANGGQLSESQTMKKVVNQYLTENDSLLSYLDSVNHDIDGNKFSTVYERYVFFCEDEGFQAYSKKKIGQRLKNVGFDVIQKKVGGQNSRYVKKVTDSE